MPSERPNVLIIMSDQHHKRFMGCAGHELVKTPTLDALAARGVRFENAYCSSPLSGPSRASFMTCRHPHEVDVYCNNDELRTDMPTFAHAFLAAGYETLLCGKMHFCGIDQRHGFEKRLVGELAGTAFITATWNFKQSLGDLHDTAGQERIGLIKSGPGWSSYLDFDKTVIDTSIDWLKNRDNTSADTRPFMLTVGLIQPHCPFVAPREDFDAYWPHITEDSLPQYDPAKAHPVHAYHRRVVGEIEHDVPLDAQRRVRAAYHGMVTFMDRQIQRLLDTLKQTGLDQNTIIVYTSDHGEQLGEHGLWWKSTFFEGSAGVPLIVSYPKSLPQGRVVKQNVSLMDIGVTMLDMVGAKPLPSASGRSFAKLLRGDDPDWVDEAIAEYNPRHATAAPCQRMVRRGPWKLCYYLGHKSQLFNIEQDPHEQHDRIDDPACKAIIDELTARALDNWDTDRIQHVMGTRSEELQLIRQWLNTAKPAEPDPAWFEGRSLKNYIEQV